MAAALPVVVVAVLRGVTEDAGPRAPRRRPSRRGGGRRALDEEIEEELEAALEDEDFDFFGLKDEDDD